MVSLLPLGTWVIVAAAAFQCKGLHVVQETRSVKSTSSLSSSTNMFYAWLLSTVPQCKIIYTTESNWDHQLRYRTTRQRWSSVVLWLYVLYTLRSKLNSSSLEKGWPPGAWLIHTHKQTVCCCGCFKGCFCEHHNHITHCSCWLLRIMAKVTLAGGLAYFHFTSNLCHNKWNNLVV